MKSALTYFSSLCLLVCLSGASFATDVSEQDDPVIDSGLYLRGDVGAAWLEAGDTLGAIGVGLGYRYNDNLRTDLRASRIGIDGGSTLATILGNVYFDIPTGTVLTPYLGAGFGYGWATNIDGVALSAMAGIDVGLSDNVTLDIGYRYSQVVDEMSNEALLGIRFGF
jgi:opacity protein-like surface antigen